MNELLPLLEHSGLFENDRQASIYLALLKQGVLGAEKISQQTTLHREAIQRELKKMVEKGTIQIIQLHRNKKVKAVPISTLQDMLAEQRVNFDLLLKPLLEAEASSDDRKIVQIFKGSRAYALLQLKLIKLQPKKLPIHVISTHPAEWIDAMQSAHKLQLFEKYRLQKEIPFELSCFSEKRGEVERNARDYFAGQPAELKRKFRYVHTELSSPLQIQVWAHCVVISVFESTPGLHILIEDLNVVHAMRAYFKILWSLPEQQPL